jgi:hypothetical protein
MIIALFETTKTIIQALATNFTLFFDQFKFKKIMAYVKNKRSNLTIMTIALKSIIVKCEVFSLDESFQGICVGHGTTDEKVCKNLGTLRHV